MIGSGLHLKNINQDLPYIISTSTLVLQTIRKKNGTETLITENDRTFTHPRKSTHIIRAACQHYGSSFKVATSHAKRILFNRHKVPILIAFDRGIPLIMIPTMSATSEQNIWIAFHAIVNFKAGEFGHTVIHLINNESIRVNASEATIQRQIALAYILQLDYQNKFSHLNGSWFPHRPHMY